MNPDSVILVADRTFGARLGGLAFETPVWIVDSPANHSAIVSRWADAKDRGLDAQLTSYVDVPGVTPADLAERVVGTVYEHHPLIYQIEIVGALASPKLVSSLSEIGFAAEDHFASPVVFVRKHDVPNQLSDPTLSSGTPRARHEPRHR